MGLRLQTYTAVGFGLAATIVVAITFADWVSTFDAAYYPAVEIGKQAQLTPSFLQLGWLLAIALALNAAAVALAVVRILTRRKRIASTIGGWVLAVVASASIGAAIPVSVATSWFLGLFAAIGALCLLPLFLSSRAETSQNRSQSGV